MEIYRASAFSKNGVGGNKAGVVLNASALTRAEKKRIARELGYSETVFLSGSETADVRLEYFTPAEEVPLCGHATVAAFVVLGERKLLQKSEYAIETGAGVLKVRVSGDGGVLMEQNRPSFLETLAPEVFLDCLDIGAIDGAFPIRIVSTGLRDILLPVRSEDALARLKPDFEEMKRISRAKDAVGVHAFAFAADGRADAVCRNFAPLYGINEESATGTSNCALGCYLFRYGGKRKKFVFEQGTALGEPSRIEVTLETRDDLIEAAFVGGTGYLLPNSE